MSDTANVAYRDSERTNDLHHPGPTYEATSEGWRDHSSKPGGKAARKLGLLASRLYRKPSSITSPTRTNGAENPGEWRAEHIQHVGAEGEEAPVLPSSNPSTTHQEMGEASYEKR
jgi:hypothetical protein